MPTQNPRERAARALCHLSGNPEGTLYNGEPMWMSYLDEVDAVLQAALGDDEWQRVRGLDKPAAGDNARPLAAPRYQKRSFIAALTPPPE